LNLLDLWNQKNFTKSLSIFHSTRYCRYQ